MIEDRRSAGISKSSADCGTSTNTVSKQTNRGDIFRNRVRRHDGALTLGRPVSPAPGCSARAVDSCGDTLVAGVNRMWSGLHLEATSRTCPFSRPPLHLLHDDNLDVFVLALSMRDAASGPSTHERRNAGVHCETRRTNDSARGLSQSISRTRSHHGRRTIANSRRPALNITNNPSTRYHQQSSGTARLT